MRLDKYLSDMGVGTRSECKKIIKAGRVMIADATISDPAFHVSSDDKVFVDGDTLSYEEHIYYLMNKPQGIITATKDNSKKTILDLINPEDRRKELFPVGRLDKDTEGFLLITNDGALSHELLSPKHHVEKTYYAVVSGEMDTTDIEAFAAGLEIDGGDVCLPAKLNILSTFNVSAFQGANSDSSILASALPTQIVEIAPKISTPRLETSMYSEIEITITEGKYHQIKRMCLKRGHEVLYLKRLSMGGLSLDSALVPGEYRRLTPEELSLLRAVDSSLLQH